MKKEITFFLGIILSGISLVAQDPAADSVFVQYFYPNEQVSSEGYLKDGKPDGTWRNYHVSGVLKSEGKRTNYLLDSIWNFYNQRGEIVQSISYKLGEKNGYSIRYHYDNTDAPGQQTMVSKELYIRGKKEGNSFYYYPDGELKRIVYYKNNRKQGMAREFNRDSVVISVLEYNDDFLVERERVNRTDSQGRKQGTFQEYNEDGKLIREEHYLDDKLHGYYREFDQRGELVLAVRYERGKIKEEIDEDMKEILDMKSTYDEENRLIFRGGFREGIPVGIHRYYDTTGAVIRAQLYNEKGLLASEGIIDEQGIRKGNWTDYFEDGKVKAKGNYSNNERSGKWTFYFRNGSVEQKGRYDRGRYEGLWIWYHPNGNVWREESYFNGREDGLFTEYDSEGNILTQGNYLSGEKEGEWVYQVGDHTEKGSYVIGLKEGIWRYYYEDGVLQYEGEYFQGNPVKRHKYYYPSGILREEQYYSMGIREKNWKKYDEEGNLVMTITYKNNIEQRINGIKIKLPEEDVTLIR